MMGWAVNKFVELPSLNNPILIEGLPGIGNVGKVTVDFLIDELNPAKVLEFTSDGFPSCVFVNEKNLIELPSIELYHLKLGERDFLFLAGDVQPSDEASCYEFTSKLLDLFQSLGGSEVVTLGGVGLHSAPKYPKVYCTGNCERIIERYKNGSALSNEIYGVVGPIVGVTGLLLGLASKRNIDSIAFLAETFGHPIHLGVRGAKEILKILNNKFEFNLDLGKIDRDIQELEDEIARAEPTENPKLRRMRRTTSDTAYIG